MRITSKKTTYWVVDGSIRYKVVHLAGEREHWSVYSPVGTHQYAKLCDPNKAAHKRVVAALKVLICNEPIESFGLTEATRDPDF